LDRSGDDAYNSSGRMGLLRELLAWRRESLRNVPELSSRSHVILSYLPFVPHLISHARR